MVSISQVDATMWWLQFVLGFLMPAHIHTLPTNGNLNNLSISSSAYTKRGNDVNSGRYSQRHPRKFCDYFDQFGGSSFGSKAAVIRKSHQNFHFKGIKFSEYHNVKIYWLNSKENIQRRRYMENQFEQLGITDSMHMRVESIYPNTAEFNLKLLEKPCGRNTDKDIAVILSHLYAIYTAIHDTSDRHRPLALIMEDDVKFLYDIDYSKLAATAPTSFGILQLVTSNPEAIQNLWNTYNYTGMHQFRDTAGLWTPNTWKSKSKNGKYALYWSAQAYLINKTVVTPFIEDVIERYEDELGRENSKLSLKYKIVNSFNPNHCRRTKGRPCVLANCLFADTYIYAGAGPSYVFALPLFNGGKVGFDSEIHQNQVHVHKLAFQQIHLLSHTIRNETMDMLSSTGTGNTDTKNQNKSTDIKKILPTFIRPLTCRKSSDS